MGRGWPGGGYTFFLAYAPAQYNGKWVIYQCWPLDWVTWHSSHNKPSVAIALQGYFKSRHMRSFIPKSTVPGGRPSTAQMEALSGFLYEYAIGHLGILPTQIKGHADSPYPKPTCPGDEPEELYRSIQAGRPQQLEAPDFDPHVIDIPGLVELDTWERRQAALVVLGHDLGNFGKLKNGVDGDPGNRTRLAIEATELILGLPVDGYWDDKFDFLVRVLLGSFGKTQADIDKEVP
jgi:peptidoglycan hydrolase-like protein with peptidoglycan-binding domain